MWRVCLQTCSRFKAVISICCADKTSKLCVHESDNGSLWEALLLHIISQMGQHRACWRGRQGHILHPLDYVRFIFGIYSSTSVGLPSGCQAVNHSQALEHDVKLPQFDHQKLLPQTCHTDYPAGCNYLTFSPHLMGIFMIEVLSLFPYWMSPTFAWDSVLTGVASLFCLGGGGGVSFKA